MQVEGMTWTVRVAGHGQPILFLHGFSGSGLSWAGVAGLADRFRAIVPDLPGHGGTGWAADEPGRSTDPSAAGSSRPARGGRSAPGRLTVDPRPRASVERTADDLAAIARRLRVGRVHLVGYSLGARIGLRLAVAHPEAIGRLVLEAPSAGIADPDDRAARLARDTELARLAVGEGIEAFAERWEAEPVLAGEAAMSAAARDRQRAIRRANTPLGLAASLVHAGQGAMEPLHDRLGEVRAPTLVVVGADDPARARAEEVAAGLPGARLAVVDGAGHAPHLERPDRFHALVLDFLTEAEP
jgi:2-succinyl-6-hydroxy-2,4-cyclohexadiene-1-carboxylate synthase